MFVIIVLLFNWRILLVFIKSTEYLIHLTSESLVVLSVGFFRLYQVLLLWSIALVRVDLDVTLI